MALDAVVVLCQAHNLPVPEREQRFHPVRKWVADYLWRDHRVILEVDGGIARGGTHGGTALGGHSSIIGIRRDMAKSNDAQLLGYRYLRVTPRQVTKGEIVPLLRAALLGDMLAIRQWAEWGLPARRYTRWDVEARR